MTFFFLWKIIAIILAFGYAGLMAIYFFGWKKIPVFELPKNAHIQTFEGFCTISVVIAARNEGENIVNCLDSIFKNDYPRNLFEVIVVDDFSEDSTAFLVENYRINGRVRLLKLANFVKNRSEINAFKKKCLEIGIKNATGDLIFTTDADCIVPPNWLKISAVFYEKNRPKMIAGPVLFFQEKTVFQKFQSLDFAGMMGITGAGIAGRWQHMANGANLIFEKKTFFEIDGYAGIDGLASGDDMLLMQKMIQRWPNSILFLKNVDATVVTEAKKTWADFFSQRLRWASKSAVYPEIRVTMALGWVWLFCVNLAISLVLLPFFVKKLLFLTFFQVLTKAVSDYFLLHQMTNFFKRKDLMRFYWPSFFMHLFYIVTVGFGSIFIKKYDWKGRQVH
jgi:glycosyltransferase involved in cell wall biosynthesis